MDTSSTGCCELTPVASIIRAVDAKDADDAEDDDSTIIMKTLLNEIVPFNFDTITSSYTQGITRGRKERDSMGGG